MKPSEIAVMLDGVIELARDCGRYVVPFLKGPPGTAKSALVHAACVRNDIGFMDLRLSIKDTVDLTGVPRINEQVRTEFAPPGWLPSDGEGILFLDEYAQAMLAMQNVGGQLIYDRCAGEYKLPPGWIVVLASNRTEDRAGTIKTPQQINNRVIHINVEPDYPDWREGYGLDHMEPSVLAFLDYRQASPDQPQLLCMPSADKEAFPTYRTWEFASNVVRMGLPDRVRNEMLTGCVGEGAAIELIGFLNAYAGLVSWQEALTDPKNAPLPTGAASTYALISALSRRVDFNTIEALCTYLARLPTREAGNLCMSDIARHKPVCTEHPAYIEWVTTHRIAA